MEFKELLKQRSGRINRELMRFLPEETGMQRMLLEACNYSVENGGKRIRPLLMESAYFLCRIAEAEKQGIEIGDRTPDALEARWQAEYDTLLAPFLAAIEMIHSSSLVHDDLPCMDNDRLRRGKPSTWAKYGEDMGTLAGDGLMIYAFETACRALEDTGGCSSGRKTKGNPPEELFAKERAERIVRAIHILAEKTGIFGMIGGQTVDVLLTGKTPSAEQLDYIYRNKTGALLEASAMIGATLAGATRETVEKLREAALLLGMAFQIQDDILDETGTEETLGKPAGSDERNQKTTYVTQNGISAALEAVRSYTERAITGIEEIGSYPFFISLCSYLISRKS
ncbi:MAG: polyprenyl synthetase family protein [Eubacteriales bacterium]|nr:polyprenyl synthetase family protein [Eubacteriales bacterium]